MKRITVIANLTKDAIVKDVMNRKAINFSLACNEFFKNKNGEKEERSTFFNATIWRDSNINIVEFLTKGTKVFIEGTPEPELYKDKDGNYKAAIKILVSNIELLGGGTKRSNTDTANNNSTDVNNTDSINNNNNNSSGKSKHDDLPF